MINKEDSFDKYVKYIEDLSQELSLEIVCGKHLELTNSNKAVLFYIEARETPFYTYYVRQGELSLGLTLIFNDVQVLSMLEVQYKYDDVVKNKIKKTLMCISKCIKLELGFPANRELIEKI